MNSAGPEALKSGVGSQEAKVMCHVHRVEKKKGKGERSSRKALQGGECLEKVGKETPCKDRSTPQCKHSCQEALNTAPPHPTSPGLAATALRKSRPVRVSGTGDER